MVRTRNVGPAERARRIQQKARSRQKKRDVVNAYLADHHCIRCGFSDPRALQFHHRDRRSKVDAVGTMVNKQAAMGDILAEIEKCDVLCANCHSIHHAEERGWFL